MFFLTPNHVSAIFRMLLTAPSNTSLQLRNLALWRALERGAGDLLVSKRFIRQLTHLGRGTYRHYRPIQMPKISTAVSSMSKLTSTRLMSLGAEILRSLQCATANSICRHLH